MILHEILNSGKFRQTFQITQRDIGNENRALSQRTAKLESPKGNLDSEVFSENFNSIYRTQMNKISEKII